MSTASDRYTLIHGDCVAHLLNHPSLQARLVFADPPYNQGIVYNKEFVDRKDPDAYWKWAVDWVEACRRHLTPDGSFWIVTPEEQLETYLFALRLNGLHLRRIIVWHETFGQYAPRNFGRCARFILYALRDPQRFIFNSEAVRVPSARQEKYGDKRAAPEGKIQECVWKVPRLVGTAKERIKGVPTQLPLQLPTRAIAVATNPPDLVLDPFLGSGTTGVAALQQNRRFVGVDIHKPFVEIAQRRIQASEEKHDAERFI